MASSATYSSGEGQLKSSKASSRTPVIDDQSENNNCQTENKSNDNETVADKRKRRLTGDGSKDESDDVSVDNAKRKKDNRTNDEYCWKCHKNNVEAHCSACPRSWHRKCMEGTPPISTANWICGECASILHAENAATRSSSMAHVTVDRLCMMLQYIINRVRDYCPGTKPFFEPVNLEDVPNYLDYVVKPMDLSTVESNIKSKRYGSTEAFMADVRWIQHNCIVFHTYDGEYEDTTKLINAAKTILKTARDEVAEIEACPDCYARGRYIPRANASWFIEACHQPHPLIWAKLKGWPYWPAKAFRRLNAQGLIDVRFFGEHNRAWIKPKDVYLFSLQPPVPARKGKPDLSESLKEIGRHIEKLEAAFGRFVYARTRVPYDCHDPMQIQVMLPEYDPLSSNNPIGLQRSNTPNKKSSSASKAITSTQSSSINLYETIISDFESDVDLIDGTNEPEDSSEEINTPEQLKKRLRKIKKNVLNLEEHFKPDSSKLDVSNDDGNVESKKKKRFKRSKLENTGKSPSNSENTYNIPKTEDDIEDNTLITDTNGKIATDSTNLSTPMGQFIDDISIDEDILINSNTQTNSTTSQRISEIIDERNSLKSSASPVLEFEEVKEIMDRVSSAAIGKRNSRAKKSFPNKPPRDPPIILRKSHSTSTTNSTVSSSSSGKNDVNYQLPPPEAGPLSAHLNKGANELARQMAKFMEEAVKEASESEVKNPDERVEVHVATVYALRLQIERMKWEHEQQLAELKHNADRMARDLRLSLELERQRAIEEMRKEADEERLRSVEETKSKLWCNLCNREALYYCCWNTAYCSVTCQQMHWHTHERKCTFDQKLVTTNSTTESESNGCSSQDPQNSQASNMPKLVIGAPYTSSHVRGA